jgi:flavodoxin I
VVQALIESLKRTIPDWEMGETMAEKAQPQDLLSGDVLLLASGAGIPRASRGNWTHTCALLYDKAKALDLAGKPCACIGLGDHRYFYTARAADHLEHYVKAHDGRLVVPTLKIVDEPYGQEEAVGDWSKRLVDVLKSIYVVVERWNLGNTWRILIAGVGKLCLPSAKGLRPSY